MEEDSKLNITLTEGQDTITILHGTALVPPLPEEEKCLKLSGDIGSPWRFYQAKKEVPLYKEQWPLSHVVCDYDKGNILLKTKELYEDTGAIIQGIVLFDQTLSSLGINTSTLYSAHELSEVIRKTRSVFPDLKDNMTLVKAFKNFKAKIERNYESADDNIGNKRKIMEQTVESDMPKAFYIETPVIAYGPAVKIEVNIFCNVTDQGCKFYLDSVDLRDSLREQVKKEMDTYVHHFEEAGFVVIRQ